ncbi:MAG: RNA-directed DNA polymerase [Bacteroidia bacterium]|nr:RNA-directed DNA polymerase [Bacteroidia bacterium]
MLYTYKIKYVEERHNVENLLDVLYGDAPAQTETVRSKTNKVYNDFSYDRFKTTETTPERFILTSPHVNSDEQTLRQIYNLTAEIESFLNNNPSPATMYHNFKIPKRTGGFREINAPNETLMKFMRDIQPWFTYKLNALPHDSAYAYVYKRDCNKAIQRHQAIKSNWFLKLDIKKFFDNCDPAFLRQQLKMIYPFGIMRDQDYHRFMDALILLITLNNGLPQGTPLSPVITNLIMVPIDRDINKKLGTYFKDKQQSFMYTRYADDMLISSNKEMNVQEVVGIIDTILHTYTNKLQINPDKTRYGSKAGSNWNLGIMYNKDNKLTVGYRRKKKIKTMLFQFYSCYNEGTRDKEYAQAILGELAYLHNIEPEYTRELVRFMDDKYSTDFYTILHKTVKEN